MSIIKLIATDMDGTALDENSNVPEGFEQLVGEVLDKGIRFAVASGRHIKELKYFFPEIIDKINIISQNGSMVYEPGLRLVSVTTLSKDTVDNLLSRLDKVRNLIILMYGIENIYILHPKEEEMKIVRAHHIACEPIDDFHPYTDELCKLTLIDYDRQLDIEELRKEFGKELNITASGKILIDVFDSKVNKGRGLQYIQETHSISPKESMAFGDAENDYELLLAAEHSMAVANASDLILTIASQVVPSNKEHGVLKTIRKVLDKRY